MNDKQRRDDFSLIIDNEWMIQVFLYEELQKWKL